MSACSPLLCRQPASDPLKPAAADGRPFGVSRPTRRSNSRIENNLGIQISPLRSADRGSECADGASRLVTDIHVNVSEQQTAAAIAQHLHWQRGSQNCRTTRSSATSASTQALKWGGYLRDRLGQLADRTRTTAAPRGTLPVNSSLQLNYQQPLLRGIQHRQRPAATRGESEESRDRGRGTSSDACLDHAHRAQRVLEPCLRDGIAGGAAAVTRARAGVAPQHAFARRDRHHAADRHRRSRIRSGGTRRSGHRRAGQHRDAPRTRCALWYSIPRSPDFWNMRIEPTSCRRFNRCPWTWMRP